MWRLRECVPGNSNSSPKRLAALGAAVWCAVAAAPASGAESSVSLSVQAQVSGRTSLHVSTDTLRFDVAAAAGSATASVDFSASARTHAGGDLVLSIELLRTMGHSDGFNEAEAALSFAGEGAGTAGGDIAATGSHVAARWTGSGHRTGRLVFTLRTGSAGAYSVPVRFVLTAP